MTLDPPHAWIEEAKEKTLEDLPAFLKFLRKHANNETDICHAIAAAATAAAWAMENEKGPVTGHQATDIMWEIIAGWGLWKEGPKRMLEYADMLYPNSEPYFTRVPLGVWEWLQGEAKRLVAALEESQDPTVDIRIYRHWKAMAHGQVPFGWRVDTN